MTDLTFLLRRLNQPTTEPNASHLEDAATIMLLALLGLIALTAVF